MNAEVSSGLRISPPGPASPAHTGLARLRLTDCEARQVLGAVSAVAAVLATLALVLLAVRAALRLEVRWDTFAYHLPFAAVRGGLSIPYEMNDLMRAPFEGYPPLPHLLQGALWRLTGSVNATGVVNYLAFAGFLAYCHAALRAPFWIVALVSLTAPLVIIHACTSYVDLFGNSFLAMGLCSCVSLYLFPERARRLTLIGAPLALAAAAWSKYLLVPVAGVGFVVLLGLLLRRPSVAGLGRATLASYCAAVALLAAAPYLENLVTHGNPFWPLRLPLLGDLFPFLNDASAGAVQQRPAHLRTPSPPQSAFLDSLFEIGHPTRYQDRLRWIIDQGNSRRAYRIGGFWGVAAAVYSVVVLILLVRSDARRGRIAAAAALGMLGFWSLLPQAHELRYYLFVPLTGAGCVGLLLPSFARRAPRAAAALVALSLGLFAQMAIENRGHYLVERVGPIAAAHAWGATEWWPRLRRNTTYCAIGMAPMAMLLTGPTLSEYSIIDRSAEELCPPGSVVLRGPRAKR